MTIVPRLVNVRSEHYDVCIMRPSIFGNPFKIGRDGNRDEVCDKFDLYFLNRILIDAEFKKQVHSLSGKTLGCCCAPKRCHGESYQKYFSFVLQAEKDRAQYKHEIL